jgi:hypothetical protein
MIAWLRVSTEPWPPPSSAAAWVSGGLGVFGLYALISVVFIERWFKDEATGAEFRAKGETLNETWP